MIDEARLAEIESRCKAAIKPPWTTLSKSQNFNTLAIRLSDGTQLCRVGHVRLGLTALMDTAKFIAHSRQDVPDLVAEVKRRGTVNAALVDALKELIVAEDSFIKDTGMTVSDQITQAVEGGRQALALVEGKG